jgi:hypothetical protein
MQLLLTSLPRRARAAGLLLRLPASQPEHIEVEQVKSPVRLLNQDDVAQVEGADTIRMRPTAPRTRAEANERMPRQVGPTLPVALEIVRRRHVYSVAPTTEEFLHTDHCVTYRYPLTRIQLV